MFFTAYAFLLQMLCAYVPTCMPSTPVGTAMVPSVVWVVRWEVEEVYEVSPVGRI